MYWVWFLVDIGWVINVGVICLFVFYIFFLWINVCCFVLDLVVLVSVFRMVGDGLGWFWLFFVFYVIFFLYLLACVCLEELVYVVIWFGVVFGWLGWWNLWWWCVDWLVSCRLVVGIVVLLCCCLVRVMWIFDICYVAGWLFGLDVVLVVDFVWWIGGNKVWFVWCWLVRLLIG